MCGIIGLFNASSAEQAVLAGLNAIQNRGKDCQKVVPVANPRCAMGHCLHAVVSRVPQPFQGKGTLVANCEIYNWKTLAEQEKSNAGNDAELLFQLLEKTTDAQIQKLLTKLDGDYAFAYSRNEKLWLCRDLIGIKPLWYSLENKRFAFASEAKALYAMGFSRATELNPRKTVCYHTKTQRLQSFNKPFFKIKPAKKIVSYSKKVFEELLLSSLHKRIPAVKWGLLFSGGIDSLVLAQACKQLGEKPTLFVAGIVFPDGKVPHDVLQSRKAAKTLQLPLEEVLLPAEQAKSLLPAVVSLIETSDPVKVGIALTGFIATRHAAERGYKVLLTGLGADGLLGGFHRQRQAKNLNRDCLSYVLKSFETDLYREDVISMQNSVELRVPYYDPAFVEFALNIPASEKIRGERTKQPLRDLALYWGLPPDLAEQPKKAAQYGSFADKLIERETKKAKSKTKGEFLEQFLKKEKLRLGALISGGKDGWYAAFIQHQKNYSISCLISMQSANPHSFMFHTPNIQLVTEQSQAADIPLVAGTTTGNKESELADLKKTIRNAQQKYNLDGIVNGALLSNYQRERIEKICDSLGLKIFSPLWQKDQLQELRELLQNHFEIAFSSIAAEGLNESWLGKPLTEQRIAELQQLHKKLGLNPAGEGGEYETLVLDCPLFKQRMSIEKSRIEMQNECTGQWVVEKAKLVSKS